MMFRMSACVHVLSFWGMKIGGFTGIKVNTCTYEIFPGMRSKGKSILIERYS